jgi:hypothetical protein
MVAKSSWNEESWPHFSCEERPNKGDWNHGYAPKMYVSQAFDFHRYLAVTMEHPYRVTPGGKDDMPSHSML